MTSNNRKMIKVSQKHEELRYRLVTISLRACSHNFYCIYVILKYIYEMYNISEIKRNRNFYSTPIIKGALLHKYFSKYFLN